MKLKSVKLGYQKGQIGQYACIGFPVRVRADSKTENPDPIQNNMSNHNLKTNTGRKLKQYGQKNWDTYFGTYPGNGVLHYYCINNMTCLIHVYYCSVVLITIPDILYTIMSLVYLVTLSDTCYTSCGDTYSCTRILRIPYIMFHVYPVDTVTV